MKIAYVEGAAELPLAGHPFHLRVPGRPRTKGSMRHKGRGHMVEQVAGSKEWREAVASAAAAELGQASGPDGPVRRWRPYSGPVTIWANFYFDRPRRGSADSFPTGVTYGDLDKLARNVGDALVDAGVIVDDSLIVSWSTSKSWVDHALLGQGVEIGVRGVGRVAE